ncbi:MAG: nucleotidyltransferase family protein [Candidatus Brocadiae bacterium]|nr:nucleotidyltransferase family protein [Candidatus Brocadiia bacterium]
MATLKDIMARRDEVLRAAQRHGARDVRLFGSVVRGEADQDSDVDLLVRMEQDRSLLDRIALIHELEDLFDCQVDVVNERALHRLLRDRVLSEAIPL